LADLYLDLCCAGRRKTRPDLRHTTANSANPAKDLKKTAPTTDHKPVCAGESKVNKE
jgi:hypothetical protein